MKYISRRNFIKLSAAGILYLTIPTVFSGCRGISIGEWMDRKRGNLSVLSKAGFQVDEQYIAIEGLQREYHFVFVNDLHIIVPNEEVREDAMPTVMERYENGFKDGNEIKSHCLWDRIVETINAMDVDGVILAADMIDYFSQANVACLRKGCEKLKAPFMYLRADHDCTDTYCEETPWESVQAAHETIDENVSVVVMDYEEFLVVGINHTTEQLTAEAIDELQVVFGGTKPIVLVTHVPFDSLVDTAFRDICASVWNGLVLAWSYEGTLYPAAEHGSKLLDMIYAPNTPVVEVLGGHLHFMYDGPLTENVQQHVFDASFKGTLGYVTVGPAT